jgi:D-sedoheptulose 7-phosphate isomerase
MPAKPMPNRSPLRVPGPSRSDARQFLDELSATLEEIDLGVVEAAVDVLMEAHTARKSVYVMGNGGSAATAGHFAADLHAASRGNKRLRVQALSDNVALLTALANDLGYENVFAEQLASNLCEADVVILISASGDSENVVRAARMARERDAKLIGLFGFGGGRAMSLVDLALVVSSRDFGVVESAHAALEHLVSGCFRRRLAE